MGIPIVSNILMSTTCIPVGVLPPSCVHSMCIRYAPHVAISSFACSACPICGLSASYLNRICIRCLSCCMGMSPTCIRSATNVCPAPLRAGTIALFQPEGEVARIHARTLCSTCDVSAQSRCPKPKPTHSNAHMVSSSHMVRLDVWIDDVAWVWCR